MIQFQREEYKKKWQHFDLFKVILFLGYTERQRVAQSPYAMSSSESYVTSISGKMVGNNTI